MAYAEAVFPSDVVHQFYSGGPVDAVDIVKITDGNEARNTNNPNLLKRYVFDAAFFAPEYEVVLAFWRARGGRLNSFLFSDYLGSVMTRQQIATGNGSTTDFTITTQSGEQISRPVQGSSLQVWVAGGSTSVTVNETTGQIQFASPPANGAAIEVACQYYMLCRFDNQQFNGRKGEGEIYIVEGLAIQELLPPEGEG
jgi:uncharacterized protein (TIGR02217 family)